MALTSPGIVLSIETMFGNIKPAIAELKKIGWTDFGAEAPEYAVKPGATLKIPMSTIAAAGLFDASSNNYLTGGNTEWVELTAAHYLQGFDITGVNVDEGVNAGKMKQIFASRAGSGIASRLLTGAAGALDNAEDGVTEVEVAEGQTEWDYMGLVTAKGADPSKCVLVMNGASLGSLKKSLAADHIVGTNTEIAQYLGFKDIAMLPVDGVYAVPENGFGVIARVPAIIAKYQEAGAQTDEDTGFSVGIVVADDQAKNRVVVNADSWQGFVLGAAFKFVAAEDSSNSGLI